MVMMHFASVFFVMAALSVAEAQTTCTASWAMITDPPQKYADGVSLALYKSHATLSDPAQPPLGWDSGTPALTGYVVSHLGATLDAFEVWTQTEGYWYYIRTTAAYPPGSGSLTLTYPCATPAPTPAPPPPPTPLPPTPSCTATWDAVDSSSKYADGVSLALYKSHATLSIPAQPPLGWDSGTPALTGYVITHLGATLDASEVWTQTEGFWYYIKTTAAYPSGTGSLTLTYPCAG